MIGIGRGLMVVFATFILAACSAHQTGYDEAMEDRIAINAIEYNKAFEKATNSVILLNILRSRDHRPRYFSTITQITDGVSVEVQNALELTIPFGGGADAIFPLKPTVRVTNKRSPTMNIAPQQGEDFMRAIMTPIEPILLQFLWHEGWPRDMFLHMTAASIHNETTGEVYRNVPPPDAEAECREPYGQNSWCAFRSFVERVTTAPAGHVKFDWLDQNLCIRPNFRVGKITITEEVLKEYRANNLHLIEYEGQMLACPREANIATLTYEGEKYSIKTRSASIMVYYLGVLARTLDAEGDSVLTVGRAAGCDGPPQVPLLTLAHKDESTDGEPIAEVEYDGKVYIVGDRGCASRTNTAFALMSQIIALKQKETNLPGTQTVRVVN